MNLRQTLVVGGYIALAGSLLLVPTFVGGTEEMMRQPGKRWSQPQKVAAPRSFTLPLELAPVDRRSLPLGRGSVVLTNDAGTTKRVEVALRVTEYEGRLLDVHEGQATDRTVQAYCYELVSDEAYTWAWWGRWNWPVTPQFRLFAFQDADTYLTAPEGRRVGIANVSAPRDRVVAFHQAYGPEVTQTFEWVDIGALVPAAKDWGRWVYADWVEVVSLEKDAEGRLILTVKDTQSPAAAVLGQRDDEWVLVENYPDGLPEDRQPDD